MSMVTDAEKPRILPLWKNCLIELHKLGVEYGKTYDVAWFEVQLSCTRDKMEFGLAISEIRRELEKDGFYISGRGQGGNQLVILSKDSNQDQGIHNMRVASDLIRRTVTLLSNTDTEGMSEERKRRHNSVLERASIRMALMNRRAVPTPKLTNKPN